MQRVLITGSKGFVGMNFCMRLSDKYRLMGTMRNYNRDRMVDGVTYSVCDLTDLDQVWETMSSFNPDIVVHFAAQSIVGSGKSFPSRTYMSNVGGTANLLDSCMQMKDKPLFLLLSSDKVLGECENATEDEPYPDMLGHYGRSKMFQELVLREHNIPSIIVRCCNIYGEYDTNPRIIPNSIQAAIRGEQPIVFKETYPTHRQYVYVGDLVKAIEMLIESGKRDIYHIGGEVRTQEEVVLEIANQLNMDPKYIEKDNEKRSNVKRQSLDYSKIKDEIGWTPEISFSEGIERTVEWWKNNV